MCLTTLYLDMNSYFASVEQQERPALRGRPVGIVAVDTDSTCCIAASYEAKACGVRTGTVVREARQRCPDLRIVTARPAVYVRYHHAIIEAVEKCLPVAEVHSIDEVSCRLLGTERQPDRATLLGRQIKDSIYRHVGQCLRCSIGAAPNRFLAKVAAEMHKPDGLTIIRRADLPSALHSLQLDDLPGIGKQMLKRLHRRQIRSVSELCALSESQLESIWESVVGRVWWHWLRGDDIPDVPTNRRTVGHSHVLPPERRNESAARAVMVRMIHKAAFRLRKLNYWARQMRIDVDYLHQPSWKQRAGLGMCQDTLTMLEVFDTMWPQRPPGAPFKLGITLENLVPNASAPLPLFAGERRRIQLSQVMDRLNLRYGPHTVYFAGMYGAQDSAPTRISFTSIPDADFQA